MPASPRRLSASQWERSPLRPTRHRGPNADEAGDSSGLRRPGSGPRPSDGRETWCEAGLTPDHIDHPWTAGEAARLRSVGGADLLEPSTNSSPASPAAASAADPPSATCRDPRVRACTVAPRAPNPCHTPATECLPPPQSTVPELHHGQAAETHPPRKGLRREVVDVSVEQELRSPSSPIPLGHHLPGHPRHSRRPQAGTTSDPVLHAPDGCPSRHPAPQERPGSRRHHGPLHPHGDAAIYDALYAWANHSHVA
ncbi:MAG: hypothetical protein CM1200mP26_21190 [Acidimicrobiales bacterium]|nr:MAG: hypothetical protein CM1200mP26_21190 [Acidimicrobiales bacterium]